MQWSLNAEAAGIISATIYTARGIRSACRAEGKVSEIRKLYDRQKPDVNEDLTKSDARLSHLEGVCPLCQQALSEVFKDFPCLLHQGTELKKWVKRLPHPKHSHYRNTIAQNEWIKWNVFDSMVNYVFCQECVVKGLGISTQRLSQQHKVKQNSFEHPITKKKAQVKAEH